ncbi:glycoside hydrolase family 16 protein [Aureitalea marina]|uniref:Laminarinase n=1 Tax=Aureitalea marina TaxID=930804 RepID=A0A2S7KS16_9FLAO|nr:glycoside hydrolase family 16 protein [Aureitalea marina]PQB05425.1 laminarinase [Aureitalea marina]
MRIELFSIFFLFAATLLAQKTALVFEENFENGELDSKYWNFELGDGCPALYGWGIDERQIYTEDNIAINDGKLIITANYDEKNYTSSRITTKGKMEIQYGTVVVRAKVPAGHGLWPAIWMLGSDINTNQWPACGEIDIMEYVGREPNLIYTSLHTTDCHGDTVNSRKTPIENVEEDFHVYRIDWSADRIEFHIDDALVYTFSPEVKNDETWPYNKPFYLLMNMAKGGNFGGPEVDDSIFPAEFTIDYIRIYKS